MANKIKIFDNHVHTQYAYCSQDNLLPETTIGIAKSKGYGICIVEHSGQLYVSNDNYWNGNIVNKPDKMYDDETNRMDDYINFASKYRSDDVKIGLELDMNINGKVTLRDEHVASFDMFLGAVHYIPESFTDMDKGFLWNLDLFCDYKVNILAHPFRIYKILEQDRPTHLYDRVAKQLRKYNVAAELNFHINNPDWLFFKKCVDNDVKIAFGSDAHQLHEVCAFDRNIEMLNKIYKGNIDDILFGY